MSWANFKKSSRKFAATLTVVAIALFAIFLASAKQTVKAESKGADNAAPSATFPGTNTGAIPDGNAGTPPQYGAPRDVTFNVTGITGPITNIGVSFTGTHSWVGDVDAVLISPGGTVSFVIVSRIGVTALGSFGDSSNYNGTYTFNDAAAANIWTAAGGACGDTCDVAAGSYRTTAAGGAGQTNPAPATNFLAAFSGLSTAQINGTWTLRFRDAAQLDTGSITAASLTIDGGGTPADPQPPNVNFDGDNRSDYAVARDISATFQNGSAFFKADSVREKLRIQSETPDTLVPGPVGGSIAWYSHSSSNGVAEIVALGEAATDFLVPNDYDGDGQDDFAVWRPGAPGDAAFYVFRSTTNTVLVTPFGQTGDDPAITGDYDGDNIDDYATFRCPAVGAGDGQCFFFYRGSLNNPGGNITYVPWGFGETFDFFVNPGDFDGDGKHDFCVQRANPAAPTSGQFVLLRSSDGGVQYINWGLSTDIIVPGDYDGDGRSDFMVSRTETINAVPGRSYYLLEADGGGTGVNPIRWGIAGDTRAPGDYDGDGKTDVAIWRPNVNPDMNFFWVLRSSDGGVSTFEWGQQNDFAVASWLVH